MKIAINGCYGGFGLSCMAEKMICDKKGMGFYLYELVQDGYYKFLEYSDSIKPNIYVILNKYVGDMFQEEDMDHSLIWYSYCIDRTDKDLIETVEELGEKASGYASYIHIVEIPDDVQYEITDYDGYETIHEKHRSWG